ncbi:leucyl aminopeptidase [Nocardioides iriomotensis]|uniref:Probable cytosol aminopeptidase n=1 Tax=Nocardioides iriomotensis TaxID=715784 RepID=A0A4Q5IXD1_9ACTN|nr:leucyl aminopeptidase [Nocardioides iriomotensis]RYU09569.1 leucyl aminopeptidase [Nocardioides iriomotensis]
MTTYTLRKGSPAKTRTDALVIGVVSAGKGVVAASGGEDVASAYGRKFGPLLATLGITGKRGEVARIPTGGTLKSPLLVVVGLGPADKVDPDAVRRAAGAAARTVTNAATVALALPADDAAHVRAATEGYLLGGYTFTTYKSSKGDDDTPGEVVVLSPAARAAATQEAFETAQVVAAAVARTRDWVNTPAGDLAPPAFADAVVDAAKAKRKGKVTATVLDEKALADEQCGGILGVGQGSANPPRLVRLHYKPRGAHAHLGLVGKGITYDSGGLTIKPGPSMVTMKSDMAGAAAVVSATLAVAELGLPVEVTAWVPMAENMVSGTATRPGDVLTMHDGQTVEVLNTDAEGRLVLADALSMAGDAKPDLVVDVATLTGACETALGDRVSGLFGSSDAVVARVREAGARVGETHWPMPISDEMPVKVRTYSTVADLMQHNVDLYGGASYAAAFLQAFVPEGQAWAHVDIAGPGFNKRGAYGHVTAGGTGVTVATLVELAREMAETSA